MIDLHRPCRQSIRELRDLIDTQRATPERVADLHRKEML